MEGINNVNNLAHAMGIKSNLQPYLSTAIGASDITLYEHVQGYETFANQGQRIDLRVLNEVDDSTGHAAFKYENPTGTPVLSPAEAFLMSDVLKNYQNTWHFGWNRQMASKTGTSDNGHGQIPDSWVMAYNPDIVIGTWVGNTAPNGGGGHILAFGESVGSSLLRYFVNGLPSKMRDWYSQPNGLVHACGGSELFLVGTENMCASPTPSPSPSGSPSSRPSITPLPSPTPIPSPSPLPSPQPTPA